MSYQQILALPQAKLAGVRKDGLVQLARMITLQTTGQEGAQAPIDKLDAEKVTKTMRDYRKDADKEMSEVNRTYEGSLKKKFKFVELDDQTPADNPTKKINPDDSRATVKAAVAEMVEPFNDEIATLRGSKISESEFQMLTEKSGPCRGGTFEAKVLKDLDRISLTDGDVFNECLTETETDIAAFSQDLANRGSGEQGKPTFGQKDNDGVPPGVASFIQSQTEKENSLGGKKA